LHDLRELGPVERGVQLLGLVRVHDSHEVGVHDGGPLVGVEHEVLDAGAQQLHERRGGVRLTQPLDAEQRLVLEHRGELRLG
jgi:hypothetical protein